MNGLSEASRGVPASLLHCIEPFPTTKELVPYDPGYISGWVVEQYQIDLAAAAKDSRARMDAAVEQMCSSDVPGDTQRNPLRLFVRQKIFPKLVA